jgi:3-oxoacyl-[acyl-carrier-protein] synthase-1
MIPTAPRRTVITGLGIVSCLGSTLDDVSRSLQNGTTGIAIDPKRVELGFASPLVGQLRGWNGGTVLGRKVRRSMHEPALYGAIAALDALEDAKLDHDRLRAWDAGVIVGNDSTVVPGAATVQKTLERGYTGALGSGAVFQVMNSTVTMNLSTLFGIRGANWTVSAACASGAHALGQAHMLIGSGAQEVVLAGGTQELGWEATTAFDALGAFSKRVDSPGEACRPFDRDRDGLVPSGGAAMLVLESLDHARARGAEIYGEILSYAFSSNGDHLSSPTVDGPAWCMARALTLANVAPSEIDFVSAHATSTLVGDLQEGLAIGRVFSDARPAVTSTKSMTGHECWMSGASEMVYSLLMMRDGFIAPNANLQTIDPQLTHLNLSAHARALRPRTILSNSFGFGGTNSALVVRGMERTAA